jgi:hypothetical protein
MPMLMIQKVSTGFDQKTSASRWRARPPQADEVAPLGHLAGDLGVVGLPGIPQAVAAGERDVDEEPDQDDQDRHLALRQAVEEALGALLGHARLAGWLTG